MKTENSPLPPSTTFQERLPFPIPHFLLLMLVAACIFFAGLGRLPLLDPDEGRNAEVAREMLVSGDWITPHYNTLAYLDKPAVFFWLVAGSFKLAGISEWAARFPSALMALGTMLLTWFMARRMLGASAGLKAAVIWATMPLSIIFSHLVIFDMTLTFLVTLAMAAFWMAGSCESRRTRFEIIMFAACGIATITKGPVGFLLPLLSIVAYQALGRRLGELKRIRWGVGVVVFMIATLPWFVTVSIRNPDFPRYALWQESLQRFSTGSAHRGGSVFYYLPVFLGGLLPWSLFLVLVIGRRLRRWRELLYDMNKPVLFSLAWAGLIFVFFTISRSKLPAYVLPATVPLSILMAHAWGEWDADARETFRRPDWLAAGFAALIGTGLLVALVAWQMFEFASIRARALEKIDPRAFDLLKPTLLYSGLILAAMGILGRNLAERRNRPILAHATFVVLAMTAPALLVRWMPALRTYATVSSSRQMAQRILTSPDKNLPVYGLYYYRTGLPFYLRRPVNLVTFDGDEMTSNYVVAQLSKFRNASSQAHSHSDWSNSPPANRRESLAFNNVLMDDSDFVALLHDPAWKGLVLVRNNEVGSLMDLAPGEKSPIGLWSYWQDSVWKIPASAVPSPPAIK
ncbi:MAG TPA: glycosyltransferase family 39 protein [Terriglobia bacterium]|nr:glycosyltransferase family 39 protein [Terriglobia bacterium]